MWTCTGRCAPASSRRTRTVVPWKANQSAGSVMDSGATISGTNRSDMAPVGDSSALRHVQVGDAAVGDLRCEEHRFREGRMWMNRQADVLRVGAHLQGEHGLGD